MMNREHLFERSRVRIAQNYLIQEFLKLFSNDIDLRDNLIESIEKLSPADMDARDFWNTVWGIAMGYKLKITLVDILTAENIEWSLEERFPATRLRTGAGLTYIDKKLDRSQSYQELVDFFEQDPDSSVKWLNLLEREDEDIVGGKYYPLVAEEKGDYYSIHDGNRRFILAAIKNVDSLKVYRGKYQDGESKPKDYWIPTPLMMELVYYLKRCNDKERSESYIEVIRDILNRSEIAEDEMFKRVINRESDFYKNLRGELKKPNN